MIYLVVEGVQGAVPWSPSILAITTQILPVERL